MEVLKFKSRAEKPCEASPILASKTPLVTLRVVEAGVDAGQSCVPEPVEDESQTENLKSKFVPDEPPKRLPPEFSNRP